MHLHIATGLDIAAEVLDVKPYFKRELQPYVPLPDGSWGLLLYARFVWDLK